jgi:predicted nucleic acid-binding protein
MPLATIYIVDAAPLVAASDKRDRMREAAQRALLSARGELVVPAPVTHEVDYLLGDRVDANAQQNFIADIADGAFSVEALTREEYRKVLELSERYADLKPGLADLSVVVLAARLGTLKIITFDRHHFRTMRPLQGGTFTLLPWDEDTP